MITAGCVDVLQTATGQRHAVVNGRCNTEHGGSSGCSIHIVPARAFGLCKFELCSRTF